MGAAVAGASVGVAEGAGVSVGAEVGDGSAGAVVAVGDGVLGAPEHAVAISRNVINKLIVKDFFERTQFQCIGLSYPPPFTNRSLPANTLVCREGIMTLGRSVAGGQRIIGLVING